jgi:DNA polymerase I-like protein with 3'-5' exonuclease and polymerase domains
MLLQVHDEMENAHLPAREISVPLIAEAGTALNWAEAH